VPQARFLILGDDLFHDRPGYRQELEALARKLAIGRVTHFLGYRRDVPDVVSAFDVFLHCPEDEPLGRALMEAMALERPVVAVASAGPAEIVLDGESGLLAPPRNTYAIAERVIRLLRDRDLAARLGRAARERIRTAFRPEQAARMTEEVYRAVLWESGGLGSAAREGS
jgi:glycosyltransferase involved in cell wall biosynthesis